ncbi:MAG TPA: metallophosphoesterase family protein [Candidatus Avacidaminococcus intestinavium]|uniref:Metallophosphoesterase family protein n=1 Tax=Candidatus Avacidaminococcus intestinavium TaxID=2840684 RepID=A0A9D1MPF3_9FIRM|nr:metallophosphoesterase family protein [Candidatus Avacidaminococcus intestinavium]
MRRIYILGIIIVFFIIGGVFAWQQGLRGMRCSASDGMKVLEEAAQHNLRQVVVGDSTTGRTIMWQSDKRLPEMILEYRKTNGGELQTKSAEPKEFAEDGKTDYVYNVLLDNLESGQAYVYRIGYADRRSEWTTLSTPMKNQGFKALVFPDSQSSDYHDWQKLAEAAFTANPDTAFFINMGDLVDNGEDRYQWQEWFKGVTRVRSIPIAPVMGNHETYDKKWEVRMPVAYLRLFALPPNGSSALEGQHYAFSYGKAEFFVLNTQLSELSKWQPTMLSEQIAWLQQVLEHSTARWKVVLLHKDLFTYAFKQKDSRAAGINEMGRTLMPIFDKYGVDVVLSAHLHTYRNRGLVYNFERAEHGTLYVLTGVAGNVRYPDLWAVHPLDEKGAPEPELGNYLTLTVDGDSLLLETFITDGTKIDSVHLVK